MRTCGLAGSSALARRVSASLVGGLEIDRARDRLGVDRLGVDRSCVGRPGFGELGFGGPVGRVRQRGRWRGIDARAFELAEPIDEALHLRGRLLGELVDLSVEPGHGGGLLAANGA